GTGAHTHTRARTPHTNTPDTDTHTECKRRAAPSRLQGPPGPPPAAAHPASEERLTRADTLTCCGAKIYFQRILRSLGQASHMWQVLRWLLLTQR
ncbi:hypothetical protein LEMLEM_LOCUS13202, partial [Lemmus lemmus]